MGDLIGNAVAGTLYYVPPSEFGRVRGLDTDRVASTALFADLCRLNVLYMVARAGSGHIGSSFSSLDIVSWLLLRELRDGAEGRDVFFSSKGHDAPGYYAALMATGRLPFDLIHCLRRLDGLPGHPDIGTVGIVTNTGSLGMGISKAKGMSIANRLAGKRGRVFVMTGDGEALIRKPIRELLDVLDPAHFKQIHRSTIVNMKAIAAITRDDSGRGTIRLKTRTETLPVSLTFMPVFRGM